MANRRNLAGAMAEHPVFQGDETGEIQGFKPLALAAMAYDFMERTGNEVCMDNVLQGIVDMGCCGGPGEDLSTKLQNALDIVKTGGPGSPQYEAAQIARKANQLRNVKAENRQIKTDEVIEAIETYRATFEHVLEATFGEDYDIGEARELILALTSKIGGKKRKRIGKDYQPVMTTWVLGLLGDAPGSQWDAADVIKTLQDDQKNTRKSRLPCHVVEYIKALQAESGGNVPPELQGKLNTLLTLVDPTKTTFTVAQDQTLYDVEKACADKNRNNAARALREDMGQPDDEDFEEDFASSPQFVSAPVQHVEGEGQFDNPADTDDVASFFIEGIPAQVQRVEGEGQFDNPADTDGVASFFVEGEGQFDNPADTDDVASFFVEGEGQFDNPADTDDIGGDVSEDSDEEVSEGDSDKEDSDEEVSEEDSDEEDSDDVSEGDSDEEDIFIFTNLTAPPSSTISAAVSAVSPSLSPVQQQAAVATVISESKSPEAAVAQVLENRGIICDFSKGVTPHVNKLIIDYNNDRNITLRHITTGLETQKVRESFSKLCEQRTKEVVSANPPFELIGDQAFGPIEHYSAQNHCVFSVVANNTLQGYMVMSTYWPQIVYSEDVIQLPGSSDTISYEDRMKMTPTELYDMLGKLYNTYCYRFKGILFDILKFSKTRDDPTSQPYKYGLDGMGTTVDNAYDVYNAYTNPNSPNRFRNVMELELLCAHRMYGEPLQKLALAIAKDASKYEYMVMSVGSMSMNAAMKLSLMKRYKTGVLKMSGPAKVAVWNGDTVSYREPNLAKTSPVLWKKISTIQDSSFELPPMETLKDSQYEDALRKLVFETIFRDHIDTMIASYNCYKDDHPIEEITDLPASDGLSLKTAYWDALKTLDIVKAVQERYVENNEEASMDLLELYKNKGPSDIDNFSDIIFIDPEVFERNPQLERQSEYEGWRNMETTLDNIMATYCDSTTRGIIPHPFEVSVSYVDKTYPYNPSATLENVSNVVLVLYNDQRDEELCASQGLSKEIQFFCRAMNSSVAGCSYLVWGNTKNHNRVDLLKKWISEHPEKTLLNRFGELCNQFTARLVNTSILAPVTSNTQWTLLFKKTEFDLVAAMQTESNQKMIVTTNKVKTSYSNVSVVWSICGKDQTAMFNHMTILLLRNMLRNSTAKGFLVRMDNSTLDFHKVLLLQRLFGFKRGSGVTVKTMRNVAKTLYDYADTIAFIGEGDEYGAFQSSAAPYQVELTGKTRTSKFGYMWRGELKEGELAAITANVISQMDCITR